MCSHVNGISGLLHFRVRGSHQIHGWVAARAVLHHVFLLHEAAQTLYATPVDSFLVILLNLVGWVAEHLFSIVDDLSSFGHCKAGIEHVLVVLDEGGVAAELVVEHVLRVAQQVTLVTRRRHVRGAAVHLLDLVVLAQVTVESASTMGRSVVCSQAAGRVWNVCVATTSIVNVNYWLWVNQGQVVGWASLLDGESS